MTMNETAVQQQKTHTRLTKYPNMQIMRNARARNTSLLPKVRFLNIVDFFRVLCVGREQQIEEIQVVCTQSAKHTTDGNVNR